MFQRKIGLEYEFLAVQKENGQAITRDIVKAIWKDFGQRSNVKTYFDYATKQPVGVEYTQKDGQVVIINTDAGVDVVEFGFLPFNTLPECETNMRSILADFLQIADRHGVALLGYGLQPKTPYYFPDLKSEKIWYRGFARFPYFAAGHSMYHNIAANQPCIDITYEELIPVLNTFNAMGGITIALFANSGFGEYTKQCCHEEREHRWDKWTDGPPDVKKIGGIPEKPFKNFRDYLEYNWTIKLPAVHRDKTLHIIDPAPFIIDFLRGGEQKTMDVGNTIPSTVIPMMEDVNTVNQYIWIQARPKFFFDTERQLQELLNAYDSGPNAVDAYTKDHLTKLYIETRNIACQSWGELLAAPAYLLGLIENIEKAKAMIEEKPWEYWIALRQKTVKKSMEVDEVIPLAQRMVEIAQEGLRKREKGEEIYLQPLFERIKKRRSPTLQAIQDQKTMGMEAFIKSRMIVL